MEVTEPQLSAGPRAAPGGCERLRAAAGGSGHTSYLFFGASIAERRGEERRAREGRGGVGEARGLLKGETPNTVGANIQGHNVPWSARVRAEALAGLGRHADMRHAEGQPTTQLRVEQRAGRVE